MSRGDISGTGGDAAVNDDRLLSSTHPTPAPHLGCQLSVDSTPLATYDAKLVCSVIPLRHSLPFRSRACGAAAAGHVVASRFNRNSHQIPMPAGEPCGTHDENEKWQRGQIAQDKGHPCKRRERKQSMRARRRTECPGKKQGNHRQKPRTAQFLWECTSQHWSLHYLLLLLLVLVLEW